MSLNRIKNICLGILQLANNDFCPNLNKYVHWVKQPIGWVSLATIFSLLVGILIGPQGFILATAFSSLLAVGLAWPWLSVKGITCTLVLPAEQLLEGKDFDVVFKVKNYWPFPVFGLMVKGDFLQDRHLDEEPVVFSLRWVPGWADTEFRVPTVASCRGELPRGEILVANGFPFGLYEFSKIVDVPKTTTVWPATNVLDDDLNTFATARSLKGKLCDRPGDIGDSIGVRAYQQGDRLKNIHWAQSARSQRLMVRERQSPASTKASVILDLSPEVHEGVGSQNSFEQAIRIAASVCWKLHQSTADIQLNIIGLNPNQCRPTDNRSGVTKIMESLASLPTLPEVQSSAGTSRRLGNPSLALRDSTFFVGTSQSNLFETTPCVFRTLLIDLNDQKYGQLMGDQSTLATKERAPQTPAVLSDSIGNFTQGSYSNATN
jgi:uncharacterized protein (DUF58 family)